MDGREAGEQRLERHGQRVHRHIPGGQVGVQVRPPKIGEVDHRSPRPREYDPADAVSRPDGDDGAP